MLNFKQTIVVNSNKSLITIAGPGSGKTHTITEKIKKEVSQGEDINKYLLLTFTNSAANEIFERVEKKIDKNQIKKPFFGTYHAIFKRLLNSFEQFEKIGLRKGKSKTNEVSTLKK
jgi:superfamily I DNA/RNA helicase